MRSVPHGSLISIVTTLSLFITGVKLLEQVPCPGFQIINNPFNVAPGYDVSKLVNCTVIEGNVYISVINRLNWGNVLKKRARNRKPAVTDYFPLYNVREITGFLLVYDAILLDSIGRIFPNLRIIRGQDSDYGLMITQNNRLSSVGLSNLTEITEGGVYIHDNPFLCNADSMNWSALVQKDRENKIYTSNKDGICRPCKKTPDCMKGENGREAACWDSLHCQKKCDYAQGCFSRNGEMEPCDKLCAGGCEGPGTDKCYACRHVYHGGRCHAKCPAHLYLFKGRRCVTYDACKNMEESKEGQMERKTRYKPLEYQGSKACQLLCPPGEEELSVDMKWKCVKCSGKCPKKCIGGDISTLYEAAKLKNCEILESLKIYISAANGDQVGIVLQKFLRSVTEITSHLEISYTASLSTLGFLESLQTIRGKAALSGEADPKYALSIVGNANLARLFSGNVTIQKGEIRVSNNPKLCPDLIIKAAEEMGKPIRDEVDGSAENSISDREMVMRSNGDKAICTHVKLSLEVMSVEAGIAMLSWNKFEPDDIDHRTFLGYQVFSKEIKEGEVADMFSNRDACSDSWNMALVEQMHGGHPIYDLKADTEYAVYVQTAMIITQNERQGAISDIITFRTPYSKPSSPRILPASESDVTANSIKIRWDPPDEPNGVISYYEISWKQISPIATDLDPCSKDAPLLGAFSTSKTTRKETRKDEETASDLTCKKSGCCECPAQFDMENPVTHINVEDMIINLVMRHTPSRKAKESLAEAPKNESDAEEAVAMESMGDSRKKRSIEETNPGRTKSQITLNSEESPLQNSGETRAQNFTNAANEPENSTETDGSEDDGSTESPPDEGYTTERMDAINGTRKFFLGNLSHFGTYEIGIRACHENAGIQEDRSCSTEKKIIYTTRGIPENDKIPETPVIKNVGETEYRVHWKAPTKPNGLILSYHIEIKDAAKKNADGVFECVQGRIYHVSRGPGNYSIRIQARSISGYGPYTDPIFIVVGRPPIFTTVQKILMGIFIPLFLVLAGLILLALFQKFGPQKVPVISINGDYIPLYVADEWELQRDLIDLVEEIGSGGFGVVFRGNAKNLQSPRGDKFGPCAVKTVKRESSDHERLMFLFEATIMKRFSTAFIVSLFGVVSEGQPALMVMELMENGNLKEYLRSRRPGAEENTTDAPPPNKEETLRWSVQIADGMAYLESKKFIHRDLAARNCMMTADRICKIGDFGMTRDVYTTEYYRPEGRRMMPVRWMSPEALRDAKFTSRSDVFSFGVVLWEIVTLAQQPYQGLGNEDIFPYVVEQKRVMDKPLGCPQRFYDLMLECWKYESRERITFAELVFELLRDIKNVDDFKKIRRTGCFQVSFVCNRTDEEIESAERNATSRSVSNEDNKTQAEIYVNDRVPPLPEKGGDSPDGSGSNTHSSSSPLQDQKARLICPDCGADPLTCDCQISSPVCSSNRRDIPGISFAQVRPERKRPPHPSASMEMKSPKNSKALNGHATHSLPL